MPSPSPRLSEHAAHLEQVAASMQEALVQQAASSLLREEQACACALFLPDGRLAAQAHDGALRAASLGPAVQGVLAEFPAAAMAPGDGFLVNDPWRGGTRLPDLVLVRPAFAHGSVQALLACSLQHQDVGGMAPGSLPPAATSVVQEGLRIPPLRLFDAGQSIPALFRLLVTNSRMPDHLAGDLRAQWAALQAGEQDLQPLLQPGFAAQCAQEIAASEAAVRAQLQAAADRDYRFLAAVEAEGALPLRVAVLLRKRDDALVVDLTACAAQAAGPLNASRAAVWGAVAHFAHTLAPQVPANAGCTAPLQLKTSPGTLVDPAFPAAVSGGGRVAQLLFDGLQAAWKQAGPA